MTAIFDALRRGVDNLPGGRAVAFLRIGKNEEVGRKELSGAASHKLGALDALAIARLCVEAGTAHCHDYAALVAQECGGEFRALTATPEPEQNPMRRVSVLAREAGDVTSVFIEALQDGVVSDNELAEIELEIAQAEEALRKLRQAARAVNAAGKPSARKHLDLPVIDRMRTEAPGPVMTV